MSLLLNTAQTEISNIIANGEYVEKMLANGAIVWTRPYSISNPVLAGVYSQTYAECPFAGSVDVKPDGTKMYLLDAGSDNKMTSYTLLTPFDPSTASSPYTRTVQADQEDFCFKPDGTKFYLCNTTQTMTWSMTIAWDISTATLSHTKTIGGSFVRGITWSDDGTLFFISGTNAQSLDFIEKYSVSIAWDLSSTVTLLWSGTLTATRQIRFSPDGLIMQGVSNAGSRIQYNLPSAYDVANAVLEKSMTALYNTNGGFTYMNGGKSMMLVSSSNDKTVRYKLDT